MMNRFLNKIFRLLRFPLEFQQNIDALKINIGTLHTEINNSKLNFSKINEFEFRVFSQFGDDGIIQYLIKNIEIPQKTFIEFGVGDYFESNTRFLLEKDNWSGLVIDGSYTNIQKIKAAYFFWKFDLSCLAQFITKNNISKLLKPYVDKWSGLGLLHIDIDGNDYWIWEKLDLKPVIVILEYNSLFGFDRAITVPYSDSFQRTKAHHSNLYFGSSLKALYNLSIKKGYDFIGCNSSGNNAYFILKEYMNSNLNSVSLQEGFVMSKFRESRNIKGELSYLEGMDRVNEIKGLVVINTETMTEEFF